MDTLALKHETARQLLTAIREQLLAATPQLTALTDELAATLRDIETQCQAHQQHMQQLHAAINHAPVILEMFDQDGVCTFSGGQGLARVGSEPGRIVGQSIFAVLKDYPDMLATIRRALTGESVHYISQLGEAFFDSYCSPLYDEAGRQVGITVTSMDVTERRRVATELQQSEARYRAIVENNLDYILILDRDYRIRYVNLPEELLRDQPVMGALALDFAPPDYRAVGQTAFERILAGAEVAVYETPGQPRAHPDGGWIQVQVTPIRIGDEVDGLMLVARDITDRKQIEDNLRERETFYRSILDTMGEALVVRSWDGKLLSHNASAERLFGSEAIEAMKGGDFPFIRRGRYFLEDGTVIQGQVEPMMLFGALSKSPEGVVVGFRRDDESVVWLSVRVQMIAHPDSNAPYGFILTFVDITERKQMEEELRQKEARYRAIVQDQTELICRSSPDGKLTFVNEAYCRFLGVSRETLLNSQYSTLRLTPDEDRDKLKAYFAALGKGSSLSFIEQRFILPTGERWVQWTDRAIVNERGAVVEYQSVGRDITDYKRAQRALEESEALYHHLFDVAFEPLVISQEGRIVEVNRALLAAFGYTHDEAFQLSSFDLTSPESHKMAKMRIQTGDTALHEAVCRRKDGSLFPAEVQGKDITYRGRPARMIIFRDLTERKQAQERLERALSLQQAAFEATADGILAVDRAGQVITYNRVFAEMWGIPDSVLALGDVNLIREHILHQVVNPDQFVQQVQLLYANPEAISLDTLEFTDGRVIERYTQPQRLGEHIVGRVWDFRDITARIRGQEELEHTLSLQRATFEATADGILAVDIQGRLVTYNHKFVEMWNIPEAVLSPNTDGYQALLYAAQQLKDPTAIMEKLVELYSQPEIISLDLVELTDGRIFERYTQPQRMGTEIIGRVWNFRDVTERRRLEAERERLIAGLEEALHVKDRFLATMSHELRTPLNAIMGYCNLLLSGMAGQVDAVAREMLERIDISSTLLLNLITQVLDLARLGAGQMVLHPRWVAPRQLADEWCGQMKVLAQQKAIDLQLEIAPDVPEQVYVDAERTTQIALNLLSNALKFTEQGWVRLTLKGQADTWQIEVRDTGVGIPPDALGYIFEAFRQVDSSSTRSHGGAGLGLAIVRNLCGIMGGKIEVESPQGQGSIFTVTLPV